MKTRTTIIAALAAFTTPAAQADTFSNMSENAGVIMWATNTCEGVTIKERVAEVIGKIASVDEKQFKRLSLHAYVKWQQAADEYGTETACTYVKLQFGKLLEVNALP